MTKTRAVEAIALVSGKNPSTIWSWFATVAGVSRHDRLAYLISESRGGGRRVEVDQDLYRAVARDHLRPEGASWAACVRRAMDQRPGHSAGAPHPRTLWRRLRREYGAAEIAMLRGAKMPAWLYARLPANDR